MPEQRIRHYVVSYDISNAIRLNKVAHVMKNYGSRVLKSVFECNLDETKYREMKHVVENLMEREEDSVRYYMICDKCLQNIEFLGKGGDFQEDDDFTII